MNSSQLNENLQIIASLIAVLSAFGVVLGWATKHWLIDAIKEHVDHRTYPIQPNANGGKSLPDVIKSIEQTNKRLERVENHQIEHLQWHSTQQAR
jgi:predicted amidohydrolase YtcJ